MTPQKARRIMESWDVSYDSINPIYYKNTGECNDSAYYIGAQYVLKFSSDRARLQKHITISKALAAAGLAAAVPVAAKDGSEIVTCEQLSACLTNRLEGEQLSAQELTDDSVKAYRLGQMLGILSNTLAHIDAPADEGDVIAAVRDWALERTRSYIRLPRRLEQMYSTDICANLPRAVIHRDPNPGNIICSGDKWGFIDFDLSERNVRIFDPCYAATAVLSELPDGQYERWLTAYSAIISGYDSTAKLSDEEKHAISYVVLANQLICVAWFSEQEKYAELLRKNIAMTEWMIENFDRLSIM